MGMTPRQQPLNPEWVCSKCNNALMLDMFGDLVHWLTETEHCPDPPLSRAEDASGPR